MNNRAAVLCVLLLAAGCAGSTDSDGMRFDKDGWGGPNLKYVMNHSTGTIRVDSGMLMNEAFRWRGGEMSFEFLDSPEVVWGVRLLDLAYSAQRREELLRTWARIGDKRFPLGKDLPPDQMWKFDMALDIDLRLDKEGRGYKVLTGCWYEEILDGGRMGVLVSGTQTVDIKRDAWNTFSAKVADGQFRYAINGRTGGPLRLDPRMNGRAGIFVTSGGPFLIRNLKLTSAKR